MARMATATGHGGNMGTGIIVIEGACENKHTFDRDADAIWDVLREHLPVATVDRLTIHFLRKMVISGENHEKRNDLIELIERQIKAMG